MANFEQLGGETRLAKHKKDSEMTSFHALLTSSMPLMMGLTSAASRKTSNSKPSPDTRVTVLLGAGSDAMLERKREAGRWVRAFERQEGKEGGRARVG